MDEAAPARQPLVPCARRRVLRDQPRHPISVLVIDGPVPGQGMASDEEEKYSGEGSASSSSRSRSSRKKRHGAEVQIMKAVVVVG